MADEQLEKREPQAPPKDPVADRSMSALLMVFSILLIVTLIWALYDEVYGQRPWKSYQKEFVQLYSKHLEAIKPTQKGQEQAIRDSDDYRQLDDQAKAAADEAAPRLTEINTKVSDIDAQLADVSPPFQDMRARMAALQYKEDTTDSESGKQSIRKQIDEVKAEPVSVEIHRDATSGQVDKKDVNFAQLQDIYTGLQSQKGQLISEQIEIGKKSAELAKERDHYFQQHLDGLSDQQVGGLLDKMKKFDYDIKQINLPESGVVDRCESCHTGIREPVTLTAKDVGNRPEFVSHPYKDLLKIHDPDRFGCSTCHGGNGRATTSVEKGHGNYEHWLWPLYAKENTEAGCNQCHDHDRVLAGAEILNRGRNLFQVRGCVGCHRYEGYDRELDALSNSRQSIKTLSLEKEDRRREINQTNAAADAAASDEEATQLRKKAESLRQMISLVDARIDEFDIQSKYLMQDVKKIGPNLKEIKAKLRKEWIPVWLADPQAFRPGTKMPTFRLEDDEL